MSEITLVNIFKTVFLIYTILWEALKMEVQFDKLEKHFQNMQFLCFVHLFFDSYWIFTNFMET